METIIKIELPIKRIPKLDRKWAKMLSWKKRWFGWLVSWTKCSVGEFGASGKTNHTHRICVLRWHLLTVHRNEYHDHSDSERADEYLKKWSACEKELRGLRLIVLGDETGADVKRLIRESLGVDLDEGTIR